MTLSQGNCSGERSRRTEPSSQFDAHISYAPGTPTATTLTFLFTDIEGSTPMLRRLGKDYADVLADHHRLIRAALVDHGGREIDTQGDSFFAVFSSPSASVAAVIDMQRRIASHNWVSGERVRVRMGLHTGEATETAVGLVGFDVHLAARVAAVAHGGQIVMSSTAAALVTDSMPEGVRLKDLGLHRLKDLGRPERIFQLEADGLDEDFPLLRSLDNPALLHNLPEQLSRFVGRERERGELLALIRSCRLVTLTGPGGGGKTRLGLRVAAELVSDEGDGVWFVELAGLSDPEQVAPAIAGVFRIEVQAGRPVLDTLVDALRYQRVLLVLDNCEHVVTACAKVCDGLLRSCPTVQILATSREPLGTEGEAVYRVPSLSLPPVGVEDAASYDAVRLFVERATSNQPDFTLDHSNTALVASLCRRLDGIPLAIELAAARLRVMSASELEARLDQRFSLLTGGSRTALPRQQTLLAMVDWSWDLLNTAERRVLARLSVFAGGFELAAVEAVTAGEGVPPDAVVVHLGALVDKSLVQFDDTSDGPVRYRLLETVRQFGARHLEGQGAGSAERVRRAHRDHYLALAEAAAPHLVAHGQEEWLERLDLELDNLRVAVAFSLTQPDLAPGIRLVTALRMFWKSRGHAMEGVDAFRALLDAPTAAGATLLRARALAAAAHLLEQMGGYSTAGEYCDEALDIARSAGDERLVADLLDVRAFLLLRQGRGATALPLVESGLGLARRMEEPHLTARLLAVRAFALDVEGDHVGAARDAAESVLLSRRVGDQRQVGTMLGNLGYTELSTGDLDAARAHLTESLDIVRRLNDPYGVVYETFNLGLAEYLNGSSSEAEGLFAESLDLAQRVGMKASIAYALIGLAIAADPAAGQDRSARLHGAADEALRVLGETVEPLEAGLCDLDRQRRRSAMGTEAFEAEYDAGRALTSQQVLVLALGSRA